MEGSYEDKGINIRAIKLLFDLSTLRQDEFKDTFRISMLEVYNENLRDLLV